MSETSEDKVGRLRWKLKEITDNIDKAYQRKTDSKHQTINAKSALEKLEVVYQTDRRFIKLLIHDVEETSGRLEVAQDKLAEITLEHEEEESAREVSEAKEAAMEEWIEKLESKHHKMKTEVEIKEYNVIEGERKIKVCINDVARIKEKADTVEKRVALLEDTIEKHAKSLDELEEREEKSGEREELNEEKVTLLESQVKESEARADAAERANAVLNNVMAETENEINSCVAKREDIEKTIVMMNDLADDPGYDIQRISTKYQRTNVSIKRTTPPNKIRETPQPEPELEPEPEEEAEEEDEAAPPPPPQKQEVVVDDEEVVVDDEEESEDESGERSKWNK